MNGSSSTTSSFSPPGSGPRSTVAHVGWHILRQLPFGRRRSTDASAAYRPDLEGRGGGEKDGSTGAVGRWVPRST